MTLQLIGLIPFLLGEPHLDPVARGLVEPLTCINRLDYEHDRLGEKPYFVWATVRMRRMESMGILPDGFVAFTVQYRDAGTLDCRAKVTPARVARFIEEVRKTKIWLLKGSKHLSGEWESLTLGLDRHHRCDIEVEPDKWARSPAARSLVLAIDRLKLDVCGGPCPEPGDRIPYYDRPGYLPR
jgi:hypothetical protein